MKFTYALVYGIIVWLIPFLFAMLIFPIHETMRPFFESLMTIVIGFAIILFAALYFKQVKLRFLREGIQVGIAWIIINLVLDLIFLVWMFQMELAEYAMDIGVTYLMIPIITIGCGYILEKKQ